MSHIDTINHSVVGTFAGISVYHTLQDIDGKDYDFSATPKNLVIGGGSGEHPGMVIQDLDFCVWEFLTALTELQGKEIDDLEFFTKFENGIPNYTMKETTVYSNLEYSTWNMKDIARFADNVNKEFDESIKYATGKDKFNRTSIELKVSIMIGEFVFYSAKKLISEPLLEYIEENKHLLEKDIDLYAPFEAVRVKPKGYPGIYGRCYILNADGELTTKNGIRFDEEHLIDPLLNDPSRNKPKKRRI
jgi:hypothetical protein